MRIAARSLFGILAALLIFNCSGKNAEDYYNAGITSIKNADYGEALNEFQLLVKEYPDNDLAVNAYFEMGKLFHGKLIDDFSNYEASEEAVNYYKIVAEKFPNSSLAPNSLFMVGFIQANEMNKLKEARETYTKFIEKYPNNELAKSAEAELENLGIPAEKILMKKLNEEE